MLTILIFKSLLYIYILLLISNFILSLSILLLFVFFPFLLLTCRYLDKFSELLYLPGFILVYYDEPI